VKLAVIAGVLSVLAILLLTLLSRTNPHEEKFATLEEELRQLDSRLATVEGMPRGNVAAEGAVAALGKMPEQVAAVKVRLEDVILKKDAAAFDQQRKQLEALKKQRRDLAGSMASPAPSGGEDVKTEASQLVVSYQDLDDRANSLAEDITTSGDGDLMPALEDLRTRVYDGLSRASGLLKLNTTTRPDTGSAAQLVDKGIAELEAMMKTFIATTPPPFLPEQATLRITAPAALVDSLIVPLLEARSNGTTVDSGGTIYFKGSAGSPQSKVIVTRTEGSVFTDMIARKVDMAITDQQPDAGERSGFSAAFPGAVMDSHANAQVIALDALTFTVHPENNTSVLNPAKLAGASKLIGSPAESAGGRAASRLGVNITETSDRRPSDAVLADQQAIGVGLYHEEGANIRSKRLAFQTSPTAAALKPSPFTIATEDYKYAFRIVAWNHPQSSPEAIEFVKFITSPEGQKTVADNGYVDLGLKPMPGDIDPVILAALAEATGLKKISGARRLSTNFRFATGQDTFDLKAQGDLERVPLQIARDYANDRTVILGFTDNTGGSSVNMPLSRRRAETVATVLRKSGIDVKTGGLGDGFPVDTNETEDGKARNRRSEVWLVTP